MVWINTCPTNYRVWRLLLTLEEKRAEKSWRRNRRPTWHLSTFLLARKDFLVNFGSLYSLLTSYISLYKYIAAKCTKSKNQRVASTAFPWQHTCYPTPTIPMAHLDAFNIRYVGDCLKRAGNRKCARAIWRWSWVRDPSNTRCATPPGRNLKLLPNANLEMRAGNLAMILWIRLTHVAHLLQSEEWSWSLICPGLFVRMILVLILQTR